jgi:hypothetical protein
LDQDGPKRVEDYLRIDLIMGLIVKEKVVSETDD